MRTLLRLIVIVVVVIVAAIVLQSTWESASWRRDGGRATGTVGTSGADTTRAREVGAEIGEKAALATQQVKESAHDASITAKLKAKLALDEVVRARAIDVSTEGSTVTLQGSIGTAAERERAVALARETAGVTGVIDQMVIR